MFQGMQTKTMIFPFDYVSLTPLHNRKPLTSNFLTKKLANFKIF